MIMKSLVDALPSIQKIAGPDLHAKTLYKVSLLLDKFESELKAYDDTRRKIIDKYCTVDGDRVIPNTEYEKEFETEMLDLLNMEIDMEGVKPVEIPMDEDIKISYTDLQLLKDFITIKFMEDKTNED